MKSTNVYINGETFKVIYDTKKFEFDADPEEYVEIDKINGIDVEDIDDEDLISIIQDDIFNADAAYHDTMIMEGHGHYI